MAEIASFGVNVDQNTRLAQNAQDTANTANGGVNNINDPNKLAPAEKATLKRKYDTDVLLYGMDTKKLTDNQLSTSEIDSAMNALTAYMTPFFANMTSTDTVDRGTLNTVYKNFDTADKDSDSAFTNMVSNTASDALSAGNQAKKAGSEAVVAGNQASEAANNAAAQASVAVSKANVAQSSVATAIAKAGFANDTASTASQAANDAKTIASQAANNVAIAKNDAANALTSAASAQNVASSAVATANSTASDFGKVSQKADSAVASAMSAESDASSAVIQASSAAADSKDAKQIAGAVSQSYKTLTDGSTMTIAELQSGLAVKLTKTDLDGYATQTWAQNQINTTADGINGTLSSVKNTVDSHTTDINTLQADSSGFKSQFDTVNDTLSTQSTDIGTLQASSKELTTGFNTLTSDNTTNKNNISQLKQTSTELKSTMTAVQTQVKNSAVGTNLIIQSHFKNGYLNPDTGNVISTSIDFNSDDYIATNGATVFTFSSPDYVFKGSTSDRLAMYDINKNYLGYQSITSATQTLSKSKVAYIRFCINSGDEGNTTGNSSDWLANHRYKLEKGSVATDYSVNPEDTATVTAVSKLSQTVDGMQTDISKKIEQKDLNGYATETWAQNQINTTADGINSNLSSVKSTVDGHTTSINDLKADSSGFKAQFTTVNDTIGKNSKDINGKLTTLQGSFDASSKKLSNTMSKVDNMQVGGTNLLRNTDFNPFTTPWSYATSMVSMEGNAEVPIGAPSSNKTILIRSKVALEGNGSKDSGKGLLYSAPNVKAGIVYTFSAWVKASTSEPSSKWVAESNGECFYFDIMPGKWQRVSGQITFQTDKRALYIYQATAGTARSLCISSPKLERGNKATDWSPAPEDLATVTAVSKISQTADGAQVLATNNKGDITSIQETVKGLQSTVNSKASSDQLTLLSDQLTNQITTASNDASSKMIQTINNVGIGFKNPDGSKFQMNLSADGTALLNFSKIMLNGQTNIQAATIGNAQIANGAITNAKIGKLAVGNAQIANGAITNAKIGNVDAGKITTGILDASHLNVDDVIANVINGKTITGIIINTPTLNLGDNGILTGTYSVADSTSYFQPINGTGKLDISHGYIQSTANLIYYNKIMRGMANSWGYWKDSVTFVPEAHLTIGNTAESTLTAGFLKLDIFDQAKTHVVSRSYLDGTGLYINSGGTEAVSSMLSDFELLSSGRAYLMGGVNVPKSEIITIGNLQINGNHTIASNDGRDVYFKKASPKGSAPVGIHAKSFTKYSQLSIKTDISDLPADEATRMLNSIDVEKYRYTSDGATYKYQYGAVIDDINELGNKQYSLPAELLSEDGTGINMDSMTGILIKTVQDQNKKIGELSMRLTRLETA